MRQSRFLLASALLAAIALTGLSGCGAKSDERGRLTSPPATDLPGLQSVGLHQIWQRQIDLEPGERILSAWRAGTSLWVATSESRIVRIDARSGVLKWSVGLGEENFDIYKPVELLSNNGEPTGKVLVVTRGEAFIFDMETGDEVRHGRLGISVSADPVVVGNDLCVGGADTFYGLYLDSLPKTESLVRPSGESDRVGRNTDRPALKHWRVPAPGDLFVSAPVANAGNILIGSRNGHLWRISADDGNWEWKDRKTNGLIIGGLGVDASAVYVPCEDQRVYAFRADNGAEIWERQLDGRLEETPTLAGPDILVTAVNRTMYALARADGELKWKVPNVAQIATVNDETVWIGDTGGVIRLLSLETGKEKTSALTNGIQLFVHNTLDNNVLLITYAGRVGMYAPAATTDRPEAPAAGDTTPTSTTVPVAAPDAATAPATAPDAATAPAAP